MKLILHISNKEHELYAQRCKRSLKTWLVFARRQIGTRLNVPISKIKVVVGD